MLEQLSAPSLVVMLILKGIQAGLVVGIGGKVRILAKDPKPSHGLLHKSIQWMFAGSFLMVTAQACRVLTTILLVRRFGPASSSILALGGEYTIILAIMGNVATAGGLLFIWELLVSHVIIQRGENFARKKFLHNPGFLVGATAWSIYVIVADDLGTFFAQEGRISTDLVEASWTSLPGLVTLGLYFVFAVLFFQNLNRAATELSRPYRLKTRFLGGGVINLGLAHVFWLLVMGFAALAPVGLLAPVYLETGVLIGDCLVVGALFFLFIAFYR